MALAFFSYTGWKLFAALSEEMRKPRRDFPLAVVISFVAVSLLYLGAALAVQSMVAVDDPRLIRAPFLPVVEALVDGAAGRAALGGLVALIIVANLVGAVWAASRLVFDMASCSWRWTPASWTRAAHRHGLATVLIGFLTVIVLHLAVGVPLDVPLTLTGQNFFLLYLACVTVFVKIVPDPRECAFALLALVGLLAFWRVRLKPAYPLALFTPPRRPPGPGSSISAVRDDRPPLRSLSHAEHRWNRESAAGIEAGGRDTTGGSVHESPVRGLRPRSRSHFGSKAPKAAIAVAAAFKH